MRLTDEVARLKELAKREASATYTQAGDEFGYECAVLNAAPDLLAVLSGFQAGDRQILDLFVAFMEHFKPEGHLNDSGPGANITNAEAAACLRRYRDMAQAMEVKYESHS